MKTEENFPSLPDKLSGLLRIAVNDLKKAELDPKMRIDMSYWFRPSTHEDETCLICLAGSVIAGTLGVPIQRSEAEAFLSDRLIFKGDMGEISPYDFRNDDRGEYESREWSLRLKLSDLNDIRWADDLEDTHYFRQFNDDPEEIIKLLGIKFSIPSYHEFPDRFKRALLALADDLEAIGH